ncbi:MAG: phosphotransferase [Clostridium baratii]|nr:phosphotransferase [Clostridium baratii]MDY3206528.1 phosphotransferase [Clostridium baratii]
MLKNYNRIMNIYPNNPDEFVSSHNDLKPENYIFDGERVWLIDWESAFLNDPYVDLAVVANYVVNNDDEELQYLENYFGEVLSEYVKARFFLVKQILHVFYMSIFIMYASKNIPINIDNKNLDFSSFHRIMWEGEIDLSNDENKLQYALVHMNKFLSNIKIKRFEEALSIISKDK